MIQLFLGLLSWLPTPLYLLCAAVIALFFFFTLLHLVRFIFELLPFV